MSSENYINPPKSSWSPTRPLILKVPLPPHRGPDFQHAKLWGKMCKLSALPDFPAFLFLLSSLYSEHRPFVLPFLLLCYSFPSCSLWLLLPSPNWSHWKLGTQRDQVLRIRQGPLGEINCINGPWKPKPYCLYCFLGKCEIQYVLKYHFIIIFTYSKAKQEDMIVTEFILKWSTSFAF